MHAFQLEMHEIRAFHFEMYKTVDFHSNLLVSWELMTEGYQGRPMKCVHFTHFIEMRDRKTVTRYGLPGMVIFWLKTRDAGRNMKEFMNKNKSKFH